MQFVETASPHPLNTVAWIHDTAFDERTPPMLRNKQVRGAIRTVIGYRMVAATCRSFGTRGYRQNSWAPAEASGVVPYPVEWSPLHAPPHATDQLPNLVAAVEAEMQKLPQGPLSPTTEPPVLYVNPKPPYQCAMDA